MYTRAVRIRRRVSGLTPDEMTRYLSAAGLARPHTEGMVYDPLGDTWSLSADTDVNYLMSAAKPA